MNDLYTKAYILNTLATLHDTIEDLEKASVYNGDIFNEETEVLTSLKAEMEEKAKNL